MTKLEWSFCNYVTTIISSVVILDQRCSYHKLSASARSGFKVGSIGMAWFELLASFAKLNTKVYTTRQRQINYEKNRQSSQIVQPQQRSKPRRVCTSYFGSCCSTKNVIFIYFDCDNSDELTWTSASN